MDKTHLHKDYNTAFCGEDASHIPMAHSLEETTCEACQKAHEDHMTDCKQRAEKAQETQQACGAELQEVQKALDANDEELQSLQARMAELINERRSVLEQANDIHTRLGEAVTAERTAVADAIPFDKPA